MEDRKQNTRVFYMDFIRALSMLLIVLYHFNVEAILRVQSFSCTPILYLNARGVNGGTLGVSLFFILSGAAQMLSSRRKQSLPAYYKKRFLSIYPAYWLVWAAGTVLTLALMPSHYEGIPLWTVFLSLLGLDGYFYEQIPNFYMTGEWFIGCILLLYLLFPWLKKAVEKAPLATAAGALLVWGILAALDPFAVQADHVFLMRIPEFLFGMYLTRWLERPGLRAGLLGAGVFLLFFLLPDFWGEAEIIRMALMGGGIYLFLAWTGSLLGKFRVSALFSWLSKYSYEWFLLHHMFFTFLFTLLAGYAFSQWTYAALLAGSLAVIAIGAVLLRRIVKILTGYFLRDSRSR